MAVAVQAAREGVAPARGMPLRAVDLLLAGYLVLVTLVALARAPEQPGCWWLVGAHALFAVLLYLITRPGLGALGRTIRELYPLLLLAGLYGELDVLNGAGAIAVHDGMVQRWELAIFGTQLSSEWWRAPYSGSISPSAVCRHGLTPPSACPSCPAPGAAGSSTCTRPRAHPRSSRCRSRSAR